MYDKYFLMKENDVIEYAKIKLDMFKDSENIKCEEIGDGNLNYVFKVSDENNHSAIVKQAGHVTRISEDMTLTIDRIKREANVLILQNEYTPELVPDVYLYDDIMKCFVMEDLSDHVILRKAFLDFETFPKLIDDLTSYVVNTTLSTIDFVMSPLEKKELQKEYTNPELCEISEDLVYTEPYNDYNHRNILYEPNEAWLKENIYNDEALKVEALKLKNDFLTKSQALIHGDLHTGSIFVTKDSTKIIDPEFTFYGPIGYDFGNLIAHFTFAYVRSLVDNKAAFSSWILESMENMVDLFIEKFQVKWDQAVTDTFAENDTFKMWYLDTVLADAFGVAGLEIIRRIVGMAKVEDITSIAEERHRIYAEQLCVNLAKHFVKNRDSIKDGASLKEIITNYK